MSHPFQPTTPDKAPQRRIDLHDLHVYGGLLLAFIGGLFVSWPWALILLGLALCCFGVFIQPPTRS